jgi:hypothetical protein
MWLYPKKLAELLGQNPQRKTEVTIQPNSEGPGRLNLWRFIEGQEDCWEQTSSHQGFAKATKIIFCDPLLGERAPRVDSN